METDPSEDSFDITVLLTALALSALLLPAGLCLLLAAAGLVPAWALTDAHRWYALIAGMFLCGFGICTAPLGLPVLLRLLRAPMSAAQAISDAITNAWLLSATVPGLAGYALWKLWPLRAAIGSDSVSNVMFGVLFLLAGTGLRTYLEINLLRKRLQFGTVTLEPDPVKCNPGEEAQAVLNMSRKAASVEASLELCTEEEGEDVVIPAKVGPAEMGAGGWTYRITVAVPGNIALKGEDGWVLSVKALGTRGAATSAAANIVPR
jgi:hypothetical protein